MVGSMLGLVIIERKKSKDLKKKRKLTPRVLLLILAILSMPVSASFIKYNNIINGDYVQNGFVIKDLGNEAWIVKYEGSSEEIDLENLETKIYRNISAICDSAFENNQKLKNDLKQPINVLIVCRPSLHSDYYQFLHKVAIWFLTKF